MELPNYSRQLMQQLQALRKNCQFCDCSILVEGAPHLAHKVVLAASSLLFKSLLEGSDSISIDEAVVTSQEFSSLLDMVYTGRLPPGKHNFTRIITAADSLQMFDVAVGCKNILNDLVKQTQYKEPQLLREECVDLQSDVLSCEREETNELGTSERLGDLASEEGGSHCPGLSEDSVKDAVKIRGSKVKRNTEESLVERASQQSSNLGEEDAVELLSQKQEEILKTLQDIQPWIKVFQTWDTLSTSQRQIMLECFAGDPEVYVVLQRLLDRLKDEQDEQKLSSHTFLKLLNQLKILTLTLNAVQVDHAGSELKEKSSTTRSTLTDYLTRVNSVSELLTKAAGKCQNDAIKEVLQECIAEQSRVQSVKNLVKMLSERGIVESSLLELLEENRESDINLNQAEGPRDADERMEDCCGVSLLRKFWKRLCELNLQPQVISQNLDKGPAILSDQKECIQGLLEEGGSVGVMERLLGAALDESPLQTVSLWRLLLWAGTQDPELGLVMKEITQNPEAQSLIHTVAQVEVLFKHKDLILGTFSEITDLEGAAGDCDEENVTEFMRNCRGSDGVAESMQQVLDRVLSRDTQQVWPLCRLLYISGKSFPQLKPLAEELSTAEPVKPPHSAGSGEEEEEVVEEREHRQNGLRRKGVVVSYSCQWCKKSFDFKCRLMKHRKRCALSPDKVQRCSDCPLLFPSLTALQQHCAQDHGGPPAKKKKTQPVSCNLCSKAFKHPSGLLYHRRTEHLEERPYVCEECGAKFAANSSLKNHTRLHTGEKPYQCKHCNLSFAVAAALSYHMKKKHAEGKMYSCQYCSSTFAQSIELTRHVRTHTGDKPYVCRECGKGFKQANGLSVHLQSFHNVAEPHDCQKCRVSFGSLDELRDHIQEVHPKEMHQCAECSRILSTATQLEKHMSIHDGSKPYSCKSCHKSYQTLSGLWYHNRTTHPDMVTVEGSAPLSHMLHCKICDKAFCNRSSLFKHHITKHPEKKEIQADVGAVPVQWKCMYCPCAVSSEQELQQHVSTEHLSQQGSTFGCVVCSLTFLTEAEFRQHFLTTHLQVIQEEEPAQMVIQTQDTSSEGADQAEVLDQSPGSQQVFVALDDGGESAAGSGIVAVNVEDLLTGRIALICEEKP